MENYSDLDASSKSEYESSEWSAAGSDYDEDEPRQDLEPELSELHHEYESDLWSPEAQLQAQFNATQLAQLHADIHARAQLPIPTYEKLPRSWTIQPFDVRALPKDVIGALWS